GDPRHHPRRLGPPPSRLHARPGPRHAGPGARPTVSRTGGGHALPRRAPDAQGPGDAPAPGHAPAPDDAFPGPSPDAEPLGHAPELDGAILRTAGPSPAGALDPSDGHPRAGAPGDGHPRAGAPAAARREPQGPNHPRPR